MYLHPGRPDIFDVLQSVITGVRTAYSTGWSSGSDRPSGVVIGSCGPAALMDDAARAVGRVSWAEWKDVGGVESVEECVFSSSIVLASRMLKVLYPGQGIWVLKTYLSLSFSSRLPLPVNVQLRS
jgi:hypothetical protein